MCNKNSCEKTEITEGDTLATTKDCCKKEIKRKPKYEKGVDHVVEFYKNLRK
jgi:hypothetical protein